MNIPSLRFIKYFSFILSLIVVFISLFFVTYTFKVFANVYCNDSSLNEGCVWWYQCNAPDYEDTEGSGNCDCAGCPVILIPRVCCASPTTNDLSCSGTASGYCSNKFTCSRDYTWANSDFECTLACCRPLSCEGDRGGNCPRLGHACPSNYTGDYADNALHNSCDGAGQEGYCCLPEQSCNTNVVNSGSCQATIPPNDCGTYNGTQNRIYSQYVHPNCGEANTSGNGYTCTPSSTCHQASAGSTSCTTGFVNNCYANYTCSGGNTCVTNIHANVYNDWDHDGVKNNGDVGLANVTVSDNRGNTPTTDGSGSVTFGAKTTGNYTISITVPAGYAAVGATSKGVSLTNGSGNVTVDFFVTPLYSISGNIFTDKNKDLSYNSTDTLYTNNTTIHISNGPTTVADMNNTDGTYATAEVLESGTYTVTQTHALQGGYTYTTPSSYAVTVGNPAGGKIICDSGTDADATCTNPNNGSVANLNFGVINENPWQQSVCFDVRDDSGTYTDQIPANPSCGGVTGAYNSITNADCSTGAGIIFTCDATPDFGLGTANANAWQAGGTGTQQECFTGAGLDVVRTSYDYLSTTAQESGYTPINLATICSLNNCGLPPNLPKGLYKADGNVTLNGYTFPVDPSTPQSFIFLINGDLHIKGNIIVPPGSVAAFSASGNIYVENTVGNTITDPNDPAVNNPNIEGLYSADNSFIVLSKITSTQTCNLDGTPLDKKLNIVGSVVTNAAKNGGSFVDNRDLCVYDLECAPVSVGDGQPDGSGNGGTYDENLALSYIMTLFADGKFLNHKLFNWQEIKP